MGGWFGVEELVKWIAAEPAEDAARGSENRNVGMDGWCVTQSYAASLQYATAAANMLLLTDLEPTAELWDDRPLLPKPPSRHRINRHFINRPIRLILNNFFI